MFVFFKQGSKLVNDHLIVEWDIPASNGILHVIERPLKAPPPPVSAQSLMKSWFPFWKWTLERRTATRNLAVCFQVLSAVAPASPHSSAAVVSTVLTVCLLAVAAGGALYFCFKPKNEGFHFRYFKVCALLRVIIVTQINFQPLDSGIRFLQDHFIRKCFSCPTISSPNISSPHYKTTRLLV